jgi:histone-lysine N-methyltransferase SETD8
MVSFIHRLFDCHGRRNVFTNIFSFYFSLDATADTGRLGRWINHRRLSPNLTPKIRQIDGQPHLVFFALRDISEGEELVYDYNDRNKDSISKNPWLKF